MNILMIGGTGLLGSAAAQLFIDKGHSVKTLSFRRFLLALLCQRKWKSF